MMFTLQNDKLFVQVAQTGAELVGVQHKKTGRQMLWQANPAVWKGHAPLLFPYCGKLFNDVLTAGGKEYPAPRHGFARSMPFTCVKSSGEELVLMLSASAETRRQYPYEFELLVTYRLVRDVVQQMVQVRNPGQAGGGALPFAVGFHPGFSLPLQTGEATNAYEIAFEVPESPRVLHTPDGYVDGNSHLLFTQQTAVPLTDDLFANDSLCLAGLASHAVTLQPRGAQGLEGPGVRVGVAGFAYTLLWGPASGPLGFVCIEPWHALPDGPNHYGEFENKPGLTLLADGMQYETRLEMQFLG